MKDLKKFLAILISTLLVLSMAGCSSPTDNKQPELPEETPAVEQTGMKPGKYTAAFRGYKSDVKVETEVDSEKIISVKVVEHKETDGIGTHAVDRLPKSIVDNQSVKVDTISGATTTSYAIINAVTDALKQSGADMKKFELGPSTPTPKDVTLDTDIVVIGAGAAGLSAALEARRNGAEVIVVEKMDITGGNTIRSSGAFNVAGHKLQIEADKGRKDVEDFIKFTMTGGHDMNDPDLVRYMIENSAGIVDWITEVGFEARIGETYQSFTVPGYAPGLIIGLQEYFEEQGGTVMLSTKATEIILKDGSAAGIIAEGADGGKVTINADAVIIAAGGYGANLDWIAELDPNLKGFVTNNHPGATGDGIVMAQAVGAAVRDLNEIQTHPTVHVPTATMMTEGCRNAGGILVNTSGKRFTNEVNYRDIVSEAILSQDQGFAYLIINQEIVDSNGNIQGYYDIGVLQKFDTIADLAKFMSVEENVLQETMDKWNKAVAEENDPEFESKFSWIRDLSVGPWYSVAVSPGIHHTMGGIVINTNAEVISTEGQVIPGLFACGEVTGGVHGGNRVGGNAILDCLVFGKTAGEKSASYVNK
ncbi:MAG: flavocytochrome c [Tissierellia bacterium]|nr:flavocytochrome c [Tissierellia bacterium]